MTKPTADLSPPVELAGDPPRAALLFDDARKLQIRTAEALALLFEKRTPSKTHQYRHDDTPSCAHNKLLLSKRSAWRVCGVKPGRRTWPEHERQSLSCKQALLFSKSDAHSTRFAVDWRHCKT